VSGLTYLLSDGASGVVRADLDPSSKGFYQEHVLVRTFKDVFGAPEEASGLILRQAETFYSSNSSAWPLFFNQSLSTDGRNGCWIPDPADAAGESLGVRFDRPVEVTAFRFASGVRLDSDCPQGAPCSYPSSFSLEGSNDGSNWSTLLFVEDFHDMEIAESSPFEGDYVSSFGGHIFLSGRLEVPAPGWFLSYRMRVLDFKPNASGGFNVSELVFYGRS